ncbi:hypothetical protein ACTPOK_00965 [Streptomyces inhibens]|uniref:hypothetical protein n=1 Tax=Streptomyces inhibens TaxID=2293571 RepID=UPI00402AACD5
MQVKGKDIVVAVAGAALTMVLAGCGGGSDRGGASRGKNEADGRRTDARAVLMAAVKKTGKQTSYKTVQTGEGGSDRSEMLFQKEPAATVIKAWGKKSPINPSGFHHMIFLGGATYVKSDKVPGKSWYTMDLGGDSDSNDSSDSRAAGYIREFAGALAATESTKWVGEEKVGGHPADHYRGTVVLDELAKYTGPAIKKDVRDYYVELAKKQGMNSVVIDMWVGKDDLVLKSQESGKGKKGQEVLVEEYSDFGAVPKITAPPAKTVATWDEFIAGKAKA